MCLVRFIGDGVHLGSTIQVVLCVNAKVLILLC